MFHMRWMMVIGLCAVVWVGCSEDDPDDGCMTNETQACQCLIDGVVADGLQICDGSAQGWTACLCESPQGPADSTGSAGGTDAGAVDTGQPPAPGADGGPDSLEDTGGSSQVTRDIATGVDVSMSDVAKGSTDAPSPVETDGVGAEDVAPSDVTGVQGPDSSVDTLLTDSGGTDSGEMDAGTASQDSMASADDGGTGEDMGSAVEDASPPVPDVVDVNDDCPDVTKVVYLVTSSNVLLQFDPVALAVSQIGLLSCPAMPGATPFSMAVDRDGVAWVLYADSTIWEVSTTDASCQPTSFVVQDGFDLFGMAFASDSAESLEETLFIAGGLWSTLQTVNATLGKIGFPEVLPTEIAKLPVGPGNPELTGTRYGDLWGFFPTLSPPRVAQIHKETGQLLVTIDLDPQIFSNVQAWAFAQWAGKLLLFYRGIFDAGTQVWQVDMGTGVATQIIANLGYEIVGAGVSTCAPAD